MAEQRQPFRFRLPWLAPSQPTPPVPRPSQPPPQPTPAPQPRQTPRPPFRPAGVAPTQPPPPPNTSARTERPSSSSQSPQGSPKPAQQARDSNRSQGPPVSPSSPPSREITQQTKPKSTTIPPPATPSQTNSPSPTKKQAIITPEISRNPNEVGQRGTSKPPTEEPKLSFDEPITKVEKSSPKQEPKSQPKKDVIDKEVTSSDSTRKKQHDNKGQQPEEEVFDIKEIFQKFENNGGANEGEMRNRQERGLKFPTKHGKIGEQKSSFHKKEVKENSPQKQGIQRERHLLNEKPLSIVTLTGENTGAIMHINSESQKKERPIHIHRGYKIKSDDITENTIDSEGSSSKRKSEEENIQEDLATKSCVNNNTQGINNSLVFNSTIVERNPGVHVVLSRNAIEPIKQGKKEKETSNTHKVEVTSTQAERLAYAPTIRRRCLRGLFLETSDSDPEKPRKHGCRIGCTQNESEF